MRIQALKTTGYVLLTLGGIILTIFLFFFVYYTWQLKYGSTENRQKITRSLEGSFTQAYKTDATAPAFRNDWSSFIQPTNPSLGDPNAPITILMFIDFECPYCQASFPIFNQVTDTFGSAIRVVFKQFPIESIHPRAKAAAIASMCANQQGAFWKFHNTAFEEGMLDESSLYAYANASSMDITAFDTCVKGNTFDNAINQDLTDGITLGVRGTPTYIVNGKFIEGVLTFDEWKNVILSELNQP